MNLEKDNQSFYLNYSCNIVCSKTTIYGYENNSFSSYVHNNLIKRK